MDNFKIAAIGGPKGGKSDFMQKMKESLKEEGGEIKYKCIIVPETAREVLKNIMNFDELEREYFQTCIFNRQFFKEKEAAEIAEEFSKKDIRVVTICDRGIKDNKAYLNDDEYFRHMSKNAGTSEIELLDDYNLVLYFVSSAKLDDGVYEEGHDDEREENKELAYELDEKTIKAWLGHRNIIIIKPEKEFEVKMDKAIEAVKRQLKHGRDSYKQFDISDYDTSAYETGEFPTIHEITYNFPKLIMAEYLQGLVKRTYNGDSSYIKFTKRYSPKKGYVTEEEKRIDIKEFKKQLKENGCYPGPIEQDITYIYEDNSLYRIIREDDKKYLEIMNGEKKFPKHLTKIEKEQPKILVKDFQKN